MAYTYEYPRSVNTVDAVVFGVSADFEELQVLLIQRGEKPFKGLLALPGGHVEPDEDLDVAVKRELKEETGLKLSYLEQLYTFGKPGRDPRGHYISTAYLALVRTGMQLQPGSDAQGVTWAPATIGRKAKGALAFDHAEILEVGLERLRSKVRWQPIGIDLLPKEFTLTELQRVYEIILGQPLDKRNFRRRVLKIGVLQEVGMSTTRGRPAKLYHFDCPAYRRLQKDGIFFEV